MAKDRQTNGLLPSLVIATASLGISLSVWRIGWPAAPGLPLLVHSCAALCMVWSLAGWLLTGFERSRSQKTSDADIEVSAPGVRSSVLTDWISVLRIAALALGLLAFIPMLYQAVLETGLRTLLAWFGLTLRAQIWPSGFFDLAFLAAAVVFGRMQSDDRRLITVLFWLMVFTGLWVALRIPAFEPVIIKGSVVRYVATHWPVRFLAWSAAAIGIFTWISGHLEYRHRVSAWPHALWKLTSPLPPWPGFHHSAGVTAVCILFLGCVHVTSFWTAPAAIIGGASMLALAGRRWEENLAEAGMALVTLGIASLATLWRPAALSESERFAEIFNRVLIALAVMIAFWHWLGGVWIQQLDNGAPWTTAGRLIRITRRTGYLLAAAALLVSFNLAAWPLLSFVGPDDSLRRWIWGLSANALLVFALAFSALRTGKATLGWLCLLALSSTVAFAMTRIRGRAPELWCIHHWPLILTGPAMLALLLAFAIQRTGRCKAFWESLYLSGILVLPALSILGVSLIEQLHLPRWVPSATFGCLAVVYLLAAWLPGPRGYVTVAAICAAVSVYMQV